jgi:hypothetical protein
MLDTKYAFASESRKHWAFTFTDLMTVLAVVFILIAVQLPSAANARGKGQVASCLYNHRQLVRAWQLYAQDNDGRLVGNLDGGDVSILANSNRTWVLGWFDFNGGTSGANTNTLYLTTYSPLASYLDRQASVFKCPVDSSLSRGRTGIPRVRSVSLNSYLGERAGSYTAGYHQFKKISEIVDPKPSSAFVFTDEREDSINDGIFWIDMGGSDPLTPNRYTIVDFPADWHSRGDNLSFADGHTETWRWRDSRTMPAHRFGQLIPLGVASPNNSDVARLHAAASSRIR